MEFCILKSDLVEKRCLRSNICRNKRGFTIVEIFIALGIVAVLSAIGVGYYNNQIEDARIVKNTANVKIINEAIGRYYKDHSLRYPKYVELEPSLANYINQPIKEIFADFVKDTDNKIYYRVMLPLKRETTPGTPNDVHDNPGVWMTKESIAADTTHVNQHMVAEIRVSNTAP